MEKGTIQKDSVPELGVATRLIKDNVEEFNVELRRGVFFLAFRYIEVMQNTARASREAPHDMPALTK